MTLRTAALCNESESVPAKYKTHTRGDKNRPGTYSSKQLQSKDFYGKPSDRRQFSEYSIAASEVCDGKNHNRTNREPETGGAEGSWKEGLDHG